RNIAGRPVLAHEGIEGGVAGVEDRPRDDGGAGLRRARRLARRLECAEGLGRARRDQFPVLGTKGGRVGLDLSAKVLEGEADQLKLLGVEGDGVAGHAPTAHPASCSRASSASCSVQSSRVSTGVRSPRLSTSASSIASAARTAKGSISYMRARSAMVRRSSNATTSPLDLVTVTCCPASAAIRATSALVVW